MSYKAIIFDLDGVICSTDDYHYIAWKTVADRLEIPFDRKVNNRLRGVSRMESLEIILEKHHGEPMGDDYKHRLAEEKNNLYRQSLMQMSPADLPIEVKHTLETLRARGILLAIGSSSRNAPTILGQIGLDGYFDAVSDGNCITHSKPHPEVFLRAAELLNVEPSDCLVVEDAVAGALAGKAAGMVVACVGDAACEGVGDYNMASITELVDIVLQ